MKILKIQVLRGPNLWSNYRKKLIQVRLDLEEMENFPTDKIPGFKERLEQMLPGMVEHECSEGIRGGFFIRLGRGTWLGHVMEHIALEIQTLAGMETGFGRTRGTGEKGIYNMVFSYEVEKAGLYAAEAAFRITDALAKNEPYDLDRDIEVLREICSKECLGPSTKSIVDEAARRGIPWIRTDANSSILLGYGVNQKPFKATITCGTSFIGVEKADDKDDTKKLLAAAKIPVADGKCCNDPDSFKQIVYELGYPVVVKPLSASQGRGATINITCWDDALQAFETASAYGKKVIVERYLTGCDFRLLVVDNKFVAAARRIPAHVTGDGTSSIRELVDSENCNPRRGIGHSNTLTRITVDSDTEILLKKWGYTLDSIPEKHEEIYLKSTANLSTGGTAIDVTDTIHPENIFLAERIARVIGLDVCGIDIVATSLSTPITQSGGAVIEVNAAPGFRMHLAPSVGKARNVASAVVDMLYPPGKPFSIPIVAVTGTNGKTTTTRLMARFARNSGYHTGYTTTDGIYIDDFLVEKGDNTGPMSGGFILHDPMVEFAVLETARGGILRSGFAIMNVMSPLSQIFVKTISDLTISIRSRNSPM
jgi:cyanophycin synthetase